MFGYMTKQLYDAEREARILAEKDLREAQNLALTLAERVAQTALTAVEYRQMYQDSIKSREVEQAMHTEQMATLLKHVAPLAPEPSSSPDATERRPLTYDEIMAEPASTKREMYLRELRAIRARAAAQTEADRKVIAERQAKLTEEEIAATKPDGVYDSTLGVHVPPVVSEAESGE